MTSVKISQISTPHSSVTAKPMLMKLETYNHCWRPYNMQMAFRSGHVGGLHKYPVFHCTARFLSLSFLSLCHAHRLHRQTDFDDLYITWHLSTHRCAFWGFCWYTSTFRVCVCVCTL